MRKSFSLLELVITITVVGLIVGSTSQLMFNIYNSYQYIRDMNWLDKKISNTSFQIVKYLENRIEGSEISSVEDNISTIDVNETNFTIISQALASEDDTLQWISRAFDSYNGAWRNDLNSTVSIWNGFIDLSKEHNKTDFIISSKKDMNISLLEDIIFTLSNGDVNISDKNSKPIGIYFKNAKRGSNSENRDKFGWKYSIFKENRGDGNFSKAIFRGYFREEDPYIYFTSSNEDGTLSTFADEREEVIIYEQYILTWTAYGLELENGNLYLYYNYRPWNGEEMKKDGEKILLLDNVTEFRYTSTGATIRIQLCASNGVSAEEDQIIFCRDSLVY
jgi:hypothetical protein